MTKAVTTTTEPGPPAMPQPLAPLLAETVRTAYHALTFVGPGEYLLPSSSSPSEAQRKHLAVRAGHLDRSLMPGDTRAIAKEVAIMLAPFTVARTSDADAALRVNGYVVALEGIPFWAVAAACKQALQGKAGAGSLDFAPSPAVLRKACDYLVQPILTERAEIKRVLNATVEHQSTNPDMQARLRQLSEELGARIDAQFHKPAPSPVEEALKEGDVDRARQAGADMMKGVRLSPALRHQLGLEADRLVAEQASHG